MTKLPRVILAAIVAFSFTGCATIIDGQTTKVTLSSKYPDTKIFVNGNYIGDQSIEIDLRKRDRNTLYVMRAGCRDASKDIQKKINYKSIFMIWCLTCFAVDATSGAMWNFTETNFHLDPTCT